MSTEHRRRVVAEYNGGSTRYEGSHRCFHVMFRRASSEHHHRRLLLNDAPSRATGEPAVSRETGCGVRASLPWWNTSAAQSSRQA